MKLVQHLMRDINNIHMEISSYLEIDRTCEARLFTTHQ